MGWNCGSEKIVEFVVRAYPKPGYGFTHALPNCAILVIYPNRPNVVVSAKLFETKPLRERVFHKLSIGASSGMPVFVGKL
jgi:hypothetical protein